MSKRIDKIKKAKYKQSRLEGKSQKQALLDAGYKLSTAIQSSSMSIVKQSEKEILSTLKASDLSVDWVIGKLNTELENIHAKSSDRVRILELLGKYINMFKDANTTQVAVFTGDMIKDLPPIEVEPSQEEAKLNNDVSH